MKLSLVVLTPGKMEGKSIPITLSQFLIGRDPQCHLRPASALVSKRHCALGCSPSPRKVHANVHWVAVPPQNCR
jgi:hypothetical protein